MPERAALTRLAVLCSTSRSTSSALSRRAHLRGADCIQLDLEDSVPEAEKDSARVSWL